MRSPSPSLFLATILGGLCSSSSGQQAYRAIVLTAPAYPPPLIRGIAFGVVFGSYQGPDHSSAVIWDLNTGTPALYHPPALYSSEAVGVDGNGVSVGGDTSGATSGPRFVNPGREVINLTPPGEYENAVVNGALLGTQFGWVRSIPAHQTAENPYGVNHASIWRGESSSFVDLHDGRRLHESWVNAASVGTQVGIGTIGDGSIEHAVMWRGSARTLVDLHPLSSLGGAYPPPFEESQAWAVDGNSVVGMAMFKAAGAQPVPHAIMWNGSATNWVDLHPAGFVGSFARGVNRETQVGYAYGGKTGHGMVWRGSPESSLDLHTFLEESTTTFSYSVAFAIDEFGNIAGFAGYFENPGASQKEVESVVVWTPMIEGIVPKLAVAPTIKTGGWILLQLSGIEGKTYLIESSLDLVSWSEFRTQTAPTGLLFFKVSPTEQAAHQFFRAVEVD